jgi:hypothetical protein
MWQNSLPAILANGKLALGQANVRTTLVPGTRCLVLFGYTHMGNSKLKSQNSKSDILNYIRDGEKIKSTEAYRAARESAFTLSTFSHGRSSSARPKCP